MTPVGVRETGVKHEEQRTVPVLNLLGGKCLSSMGAIGLVEDSEVLEHRMCPAHE